MWPLNLQHVNGSSQISPLNKSSERLWYANNTKYHKSFLSFILLKLINKNHGSIHINPNISNYAMTFLKNLQERTILNHSTHVREVWSWFVLLSDVCSRLCTTFCHHLLDSNIYSRRPYDVPHTSHNYWLFIVSRGKKSCCAQET